MKASELVNGDKLYFWFDGQAIQVRYIGFAIDKYLFENLETVDEHGHFTLSADEVERITDIPV